MRGLTLEGDLLEMANQNAKELEQQIKKAVQEGKKLKKDELQKMADVYCATLDSTIECYQFYKEQAKKEKAEKKLKAFSETHCTFSYEGQTLEFRPVFARVNNTLAIVWRSNIDKNAIYYLYENKDSSIIVKGDACVSSKSKSYDYRKALVKGNEGQVVKMINDILKGCRFADFLTKASFFKGFREVEIKGMLKNLSIRDGKENLDLLKAVGLEK